MKEREKDFVIQKYIFFLQKLFNRAVNMNTVSRKITSYRYGVSLMIISVLVMSISQ